MDKEITVWMSHEDVVIECPEGFEVTAYDEQGQIAAFENEEKKIYAVQWHPEMFT